MLATVTAENGASCCRIPAFLQPCSCRLPCDHESCILLQLFLLSPLPPQAQEAAGPCGPGLYLCINNGLEPVSFSAGEEEPLLGGIWCPNVIRAFAWSLLFEFW